MKYFTDVEGKTRLRSSEEIGEGAWGGIAALIEKSIDNGSFGESFPSNCPDGSAVAGADRSTFFSMLRAEVPEIETELGIGKGNLYVLHPSRPPDVAVVLDVIQFCYAHVAKPVRGKYHSYFDHHHLTFDVETGQVEFRTRINRIFARNGIVFELEHDGMIRRLIPVEIEDLYKGSFVTPDADFNKLMQDAMSAFRAPGQPQRERAVEKLWDAWERLKTLQGGHKKTSAGELLDRAANDNPKLRQVLEDEALSLTRLGNDFRIRHHEVGKVALTTSAHVDYVFYRMLSLISLLVPHAG